MRILVINGPNLNLLGKREPEIYGHKDYQDLISYIRQAAADLDLNIEIRQTNHEGVIIDWIQEADGVFDGIIINPAGYSHTSIAILDAIKAIAIPTVEVHLSDIFQRDDFRRHSITGPGCRAIIAGHGFDGYREAMEKLVKN